MDWNHLHYFRIAGRLQHVTGAAEQLGISQPALSRALKRLQADLGVPLFEHVGRSIRLTRHGKMILKRVERGFSEVENGFIELANLTGPKSGTVAVGFLRTLGARYVPEMILRFAESSPDIRFSFSQNNSVVLAEQMERGELDVIFTAARLKSTAFRWARIADQELVLIVPSSHRLAHRRRVALCELSKDPFVCFKPGHAFRHLTDSICRKAGFTPKTSFEGDDSSSIPGFVAAGFGVAIMPPESGAWPGVVSLHINPPVTRMIGIAWVADRCLPPSAQSFLDFTIASESSPLR